MRRWRSQPFSSSWKSCTVPKDRERGVPATVAWLCEELGELAQAVRKGDDAARLHELGDVLAWLASLANQLGLSLEEAALRYRDDPPR